MDSGETSIQWRKISSGELCIRTRGPSRSLTEVAPIVMRAYIDRYTTKDPNTGAVLDRPVNSNFVSLKGPQSVTFILEKDPSDEHPAAAALALIFFHAASFSDVILGGLADRISESLAGRLGK